MKRLLYLGVFLLLTACQTATGAEDLNQSGILEAEQKSDTPTATVALKGHTAEIKGTGIKKEEDALIIHQEGTYLFTGNYQGNIVVRTKQSERVHLILDGVTIETNKENALKVEQAGQAIITLTEQSTNVLKDASTSEKEVKATIASQANLSFNGSGTLQIETEDTAIENKGTLVLTSSNLDLASGKDTLVAEEGIVIKDGSLKVRSKANGLVTTQKKKDKTGYIQVENSTLNVVTHLNALQATGNIEIDNGTYIIETSATSLKDNSAKGMKAKGSISITNGHFIMETTDDSIHAKHIAIEDGIFQLASGDDAIHADENLTIKGGQINISHSLEGLEATTIDIAGGNLQLVATDDAINAATDVKNITPSLTISDGTITIQSQGDGIDVNGNLTMTGGNVTIFASPDNQNMVIDYDLNFNLEGGSLVGAGTVGFIGDAPYEAMRTYYKQPTVTVPLVGYLPGTQIALYDSLGQLITQVTPTVHTAYIIVSSPTLVHGETYSILINGQPVGTTQAMVSTES